VSATEVSIRPAGEDDVPAVRDALLWAFNWSPDRPALDADAVLAMPEIAHYLVGWPAVGEEGCVAAVAGRSVGAAWWRYLSAEDRGYGYVADGVPELSIGVHPDHRGRGVGRRLLRHLLAAAATRGIARVSLSVERENRARELYLREGFVVVGGDSSADTMVAEPAAVAGRGRVGTC
jgi:GNAT superfamily N-acetyltransferase